MEKIIRTLENIRDSKNISYDEIANAVGLTRTNVWRIFNLKSKPQAENLCNIAKHLGHDFEKLILDSLKDSEPKKDAATKKKVQKPKATNEVKKESKTNQCPDCTYKDTPSGLTIRVLKCDNCKKAKK